MQLFSIYKCQKGLHGLGFCKIKYFLKIIHYLLTFFISSNKSYEKDVIYIKDKYPYNALIYRNKMFACNIFPYILSFDQA